MADDITLRRRLSPPTTPYNIALRGLSSRTTSVSGEVYWRDANDPTSEFQLLGEAKAGSSVVVPFDLKGRTLDLRLIAKTANGYRSTNIVADGAHATFSIGPPALTALSFSSPNVTGTIANNGGTGDISILRKLSTDTEFSAIQTVSSSTTTFTDTPTINGTYEYKLTQAGLVGESNTLDAVVTGGGTGTGTPPDTLSAIYDGVTTVSLSWTNHGGTGSNIVESKIGSSGAWNVVHSVSSATTTDDVTVDQFADTYVIYFRVSNNSVTGYSNVANQTILPA